MGGLAAAFAGSIKVARKSNKSGEMRWCKCSGLLRFLRAVRELSSESKDLPFMATPIGYSGRPEDGS